MPEDPNSYTPPTYDCSAAEHTHKYSTQPVVVARGAATTFATGTITLGTVAAGNNVSIGGQAFTAVAATATPTSVQFALGADSAATAANLVAAIAAHPVVGKVVDATASGAAITVTAKVKGIAGNYLALATNSTATVTLSGATLSGGGTGTGKTLITVDGLQFRDASGDGTLQPFEDWRRSEICRAKDLVTRLTLDQKIGLMERGRNYGGQASSNGTISASDWRYIAEDFNRDVNAATSGQPDVVARYFNHLEELAEALPFAIPHNFIANPTHNASFSVAASGSGSFNAPSLFTPFTGMLGMGAIADTKYQEAFGDVIRREYRAIGMHSQFGPLADLATEPRWSRVSELMGSNANAVGNLIAAQVRGMVGNNTGDIRNGVSAILKHFPGHGPEYKGMDGHNANGRFTVYPGGAFNYHLIPFQMGFDAGAAGIMPNYTIQKDQYDINPLQVPSAYSYELITLIAKKKMGLGRSEALICNDSGTMGAGDSNGNAGAFNLEGVPLPERYALWLHAGSHQTGMDDSIHVKTAYDQGLVSMDQIDDAVLHILLVKYKLGLFENPYVDETAASSVVRSQANRQLGFDGMRRSITLLYNGHHMAPTTNRYLPIVGSRSYLDANGDGTISVNYDGVVDSLTEGTNTDFMDDIAGKYDYTSAASTGVLPIANAADLATADIAVIRISTRPGSYTMGVPLSYDHLLTDEEAQWQTDTSVAAAAASKKKVIDAFRVRDGYKKADGTQVAATNPNLKIILVVNVTRPPIIRGFVSGLVSLDELAGQSGSYPSVSDESNIRQRSGTYTGGGGVDAVVAEYGSSDRAVLDVLFNQHRPATWMGNAWTSYGNGHLPMELPSTDREVDEQFEDLPDDTWAPLYRVGAGNAMPTN